MAVLSAMTNQANVQEFNVMKKSAWVQDGISRMAMLACAVLLAACAAPPTAAPKAEPTAAATATPAATAAATTASSGMMHDHGSMMMDAPVDAMFIDGMIVHHEGAIAMAKQAQTEAQRPEIKQLAGEIIKAQEAEIKQMQEWRAAWFPDLKNTGGMMDNAGAMMNMGPMEVAAGDEPFDIRFIDAMIPHHEGALMMAQMVQQRSQRPEIKQLADEIIKAQTAEIEQMKKWRTEWSK
jgi:uncharacterized protein (DUF305 family)